ncbi:DUF2332 domain-containing protein [Alteraurantiacibacter aquimixticola]|uniref:DUF2332 domain-containing protein n=2 Tax=Alteraurantiacibacter aquimixticola TaxID=2489173 RepID=A0A4T3F6Q7_9SPHN|nr:DUF2332 domain-containing protein [Alteraurantiacibacter aquimixticola]TIX52144.1 DUF2332 domain-containing protein [Alteraurantiacibacter aquimixticola]
MDIPSVAEALEWHADHADRADAPITARVIRALVAVMAGETATARRLNGWAGQAIEDALALRVAAGIHALHLSGEEKRLEPVYTGLVTDQGQVDAIVVEAVETFDHKLLPWFDGPPQTNEAGRSSSVMAALLWLSERLGPKFELTEIGASAGINTMMGRYHYNLGGTKAGPSLSSMQLRPEWRGPPPPQADVEITDIAGCDIAPVDLTDERQAQRLKAYIWADAQERMARMDAAIAMATKMPPELVRRDAGEFVRQRLARPQESGVTRVLFHTIMWQYLPAETRADITTMMDEAGAAATPDKPLAWVRLETNRETFRHELKVKYWPMNEAGGEEVVQLAEAHPHGAWVEWLAG